ncbi:Metal-dependent hydrolase, endonuclease/exonuclease/phosphatase family [Mariniphaga anaerophila]|uniref:Metal-dependent hydrolase, endonuclease/exonuclease/phosphatase family n=2 Tax=Mariniphaga anaerophila TaxID=1484053 RepID=A0A1M5DY47_9BACT|nr:Metal-dependent hydrolase, endonuclease/exonuclease/phosphatase family [Mariniphaga anaerophila]
MLYSSDRFLVKVFTIVVGVFFLFACEKEQEIPEKEEDKPDTEEPVSMEFSVMSFNLRNQKDSDPQSLDLRKENIRKVILDNKPDVLGVQELAADWMSDWLSEQLNNAGYDKYLSSGQYGSPKIIYYRRSRFSRKAQGTFQMQFSDNRAGTWAILMDNETKERYFFCNSHWTTASSEDRVATANIISNVVKTNSAGLPVVVLGDFNAKPNTPEILALKNNGSIKLACAHQEKGNTYHAWTGTGSKKIDWIFYSNQLDVMDATVIITSYSGYYPSDHFPIRASFKLKE